MQIITIDTPVHHRRTLFIADLNTLAQYDEDRIVDVSDKYLKKGVVRLLITPFIKTSIEVSKDIFERLKIKKMQDIAKGEIDYCAQNFKFPAQHPANGVVYACPDYQSEFYLPIANFHEYTFQLKLGAFVEMCASLGAKKCTIIYAEENGKEINLNLKSTGVYTSAGEVDIEAKNKTSETHSVSFNSEYDFPKPAGIKEYNSKWISSEPSWSTLQRLRLNNGIFKYKAELNYCDEMGIDRSFATKLGKKGINIGGTFNEIKKKKFVYEVEFWEM
jgi:hypothetical protein